MVERDQYAVDECEISRARPWCLEIHGIARRASPEAHLTTLQRDFRLTAVQVRSLILVKPLV